MNRQEIKGARRIVIKIGSSSLTGKDGAGLDSGAVEKLVEIAADRKSTRLNSSHVSESRMPSSA